MKQLNRLFYGRHSESRQQTGGAKRFFVWSLLVVSAIILRMLLPFSETVTAGIHETIVDALYAQTNWGRQCLTGSQEFPMLPTIALACVKWLSTPFGINPVHLLTAFCQVWGLCYFIRLTGSPKRFLFCALILIGFAYRFPFLTDMFVSADPVQLVAVLLPAAIFHMYRWHEKRILRDAVLTTVSASLLVFCGPPAFAVGASILLMCSIEIALIPDLTDEFRIGARVILWGPFAYCVILLLLAGRLIMDNAFFSVESLAQIFAATSKDSYSARTVETLYNVPHLFWGGIACLVYFLKAELHKTAVTVLVTSLVALAVLTGMKGCGLYVPAGNSILIMLGGIAIFLPYMRQTGKLSSSHYILSIFIALAALAFPAKISIRPAPSETRLPAPSKEQISNIIDQYWPGSRVVLCGVRLPAFYADPKEKRFISAVDFYPNRFLNKADAEQLYLLLPPKHSPYSFTAYKLLEDLRTGNPSWLLVETAFPDGWQLCRCVKPPENETRLEFLE